MGLDLLHVSLSVVLGSAVLLGAEMWLGRHTK